MPTTEALRAGILSALADQDRNKAHAALTLSGVDVYILDPDDPNGPRAVVTDASVFLEGATDDGSPLELDFGANEHRDFPHPETGEIVDAIDIVAKPTTDDASWALFTADLKMKGWTPLMSGRITNTPIRTALFIRPISQRTP